MRLGTPTRRMSIEVDDPLAAESVGYNEVKRASGRASASGTGWEYFYPCFY
jgi:hypothetical protein